MTPQSCPHAAAPPPASTLEVIQVFDTFLLERRSATLDGSIPLRAAQGCKPFLEGNEAGFHLRFRTTSMIERTGDTVALRLTDESFAAANLDYEARVNQLVQDGYLRAGGYWHQELLKGFACQEGATLKVWTGLLLRPDAAALWLVSGAFNRQCLVKVAEFIISEYTSYVPLILELDSGSLRHQQNWLDTELATLTPLRSGARVSTHTLSERPEIGRAFLDFFQPEYLERRGEGKYGGSYRRLVFPAGDPVSDQSAVCELAFAGGYSTAASVGRFERFATSEGFALEDPHGRTLEFGLLHSSFDISGRWDGLNLRDLTEAPEDSLAVIEEEWTRLFGAGSFERARFWASYLLPHLGPHRGEALLTLMPWVLARTTTGWSFIFDGISFPNLDGLRGVVASDVFPVVSPEYQFFAPGEFSIPAGTVIARALPVPRSLLHASGTELVMRAQPASVTMV